MVDFNTVGQPNYAAPLVNFGGLNPQQQQQQKKPQQPQQNSPGQTLGAGIGKWLQQYFQQQQQPPQQVGMSNTTPPQGTSSGSAIY